jgi:hypothetical protein
MTTPQVDPNRIVVGVDGSKPSDDALRWGRFLAESIGATLQAVFAWPSIAEWASPWVAADWPGVPQDLDPSKNATRVLGQALDRVFGDDRPARLQVTVADGSPTKTPLQISERPDARGRQPRPRWVHRPAARLGQRRLRRARSLPGPCRPRPDPTTAVVGRDGSVLLPPHVFATSRHTRRPVLSRPATRIASRRGSAGHSHQAQGAGIACEHLACKTE